MVAFASFASTIMPKTPIFSATSVVFLIYLLLFSFYILTSSCEIRLLETNTFNIPNLILLMDALSNIGVMGQVLFNFFFAIVLLEGIILFVALFGSIVLTLKESVVKEVVNKQLARGTHFISYFSNNFKQSNEKNYL